VVSFLLRMPTIDSLPAYRILDCAEGNQLAAEQRDGVCKGIPMRTAKLPHFDAALLLLGQSDAQAPLLIINKKRKD